ncbi:MAG: hypothetical protein WCH40_03615, partial [Verrucomicrobiales bacterium]
LMETSLLGAVPLVWVPASDVPQPYQQLLVHDHDMTSELASFYGESIALTVLQAKHTGNDYLREVVLHTSATRTPVEYGLIKINLDSFPVELRPRILAGETPLGAILNASGLSYRSEPQGFFTIPAARLETIFPQSATGKILYGRYNHLICGEITILARILEILPTSQLLDLPLITSHPIPCPTTTQSSSAAAPPAPPPPHC